MLGLYGYVRITVRDRDRGRLGLGLWIANLKLSLLAPIQIAELNLTSCMQEIAHRHTVANFYTTVVVPVAELTLKVYANKGNVTYCVDMHVRSIQQHKYIDQ